MPGSGHVGEITLVMDKCQRSNYWHKSKPEDHKISIIILFLQLECQKLRIWGQILDIKPISYGLYNIAWYGKHKEIWVHMDMKGRNEPLEILQNMAHIDKNYKFWFNTFWQFVSCYEIYPGWWNMASCLFIYWFQTDGIIDSLWRLCNTDYVRWSNNTNAK